jgi:hypothetical protein
MSETQRARFKHAVVGQGVTTAQASLSPHNRDEWALLEAARRWLEQPDQERLHAAEASVKAARRSYHQPETYAHAIAVARAAGETDACAAAWAIKTLYPDHSFQDWTSPPEDWEPPPLGAQWQIEAAWQILHDRDPPDLIISTDTPART